MGKSEKYFHEAIQTLRSEYYNYIKNNDKLKNYEMQINSKFVDLLIINEIIHEK